LHLHIGFIYIALGISSWINLCVKCHVTHTSYLQF